ncbi:MAG: hypothetical protein ACJA1A_003879, partial [Saprospiraceae bacterium]
MRFSYDIFTISFQLFIDRAIKIPTTTRIIS